MRNSSLIALRELKERLTSRSYLMLSIFGPLIVLGLLYLMFVFGGNKTDHWNVLIADPGNIMSNKILANEDPNVTYSFANGYIEIEEFAAAKKYQEFDAMVEINEKILSNKVSHVFYRNQPTFNLQGKVQYQVERRVEEVMVERFTDLTVAKFREIKQPINFSFKNVYDPYDESSDLRSWAGFFFGAIILLFIALFGMTILRSITLEKSNRIVEVLLASVKARQLMFGKILGIGGAALIQFLIWAIIIGGGLYLMRSYLFIDVYDASAMNISQVTEEVHNLSLQEKMYGGNDYNFFTDLVFQRINYSVMIPFFIFFFIGGYFFYGSFFASIGATAGTESDGQQFVLPLLILLGLSFYAGYYAMQNPDAPITEMLQYLPFTSPVVIMVKLAHGLAPGEAYIPWLALIILIISSFVFLAIAGRLYKNGLLQFGHQLRLKHVFKWLRKS